MAKKRSPEDDKTNLFVPFPLIKNILVMVPSLVGVLLKNPHLIKDNVPVIWQRLKMGRAPWKALEKSRNPPIGLTQEDLDSVTEEDIKRATHKEKYLRPVRFSPVNHPLIVALAKKLGAFDESVSRREYAQRVYKFVKNNIKMAFGPMKDPIEIMRTGSGVCIDQGVLAGTIAKAGGVPAKCAILDVSLADRILAPFAEVDPGIGEAFGLLGAAWPHGSLYFYIDGEWVSADVVMSDELQASLGNPLSEMGKEVEEYGLSERKANIYSLSESLPIGMAASGLLMGLLRGTMDNMNIRVDELREEGKKILEEKGGDGYMEQFRKKMEPAIPELPSLEEIEEFRKKAEIPNF
jgi:hypothetical protein